jgi:CubicO group peptidase (beta-lactamase class C family)
LFGLFDDRPTALRAGQTMLVAGALILSAVPSAVAGDSTGSVFYQGPLTGGVPVQSVDSAKYKHCAEPAGANDAYGTATPEQVGLDAAALKRLADYHVEKGQRTLYVFRFGCLVQTGALNSLFENTPQHQWSMTKMWSDAVISRAVQMGFFDVHDTFGKYFPGLGDAVKQSITAQQLLQHTSGIHMAWGNQVPGMRFDRIQQFVNLPQDHAPGTFFEYTQIGPAVVNAMLEEAVRKHGYADFQDFAQRELFSKIGIDRDDYVWLRDRVGHTEGYSELHMPPVKMGRLGLLLLNGGEYNGEQLLNKNFQREAVVGSSANPGFGYQTWINDAPWYRTIQLNGTIERLNQPLIASAPRDMYYGWGWRGRHIFVMPKLQMMVVSTSIDHDMEFNPSVAGSEVLLQGKQLEGYQEFFRILMSAVLDQKVPDVGAYRGHTSGVTEFDPGPWTDSDATVHDNLMVPAKNPDTNYSGVQQNMADYQRVAAKRGPFPLFN